MSSNKTSRAQTTRFLVQKKNSQRSHVLNIYDFDMNMVCKDIINSSRF